MDRNTTKKAVAYSIAKLLKKTLYLDANSTSCGIAYQPKAPKELSKFRRKR